MRNRKYTVPKNYESKQAVLVAYDECNTSIHMGFMGVSLHDLKELGVLIKCEDWCMGSVLVERDNITVMNPDWFMIEYIPRKDLLASLLEQLGYTLILSSKIYIP